MLIFYKQNSSNSKFAGGARIFAWPFQTIFDDQHQEKGIEACYITVELQGNLQHSGDSIIRYVHMASFS